jgi:TRAF3-interacting protein 1
LTSEHYESRDRKVTYLQKMIDLVQLMTKEEVAAKPAKIVAGLEP